MCNYLAAAVAISALSSVAEGYSDSKKIKAEGKAASDERKRQAKFLGQTDAVVGSTLNDHSQANREKQQAEEVQQGTRISSNAVQQGVDLFTQAGAANDAVQAGGKVTGSQRSELARQTANTARVRGGGNARLAAPGLAGFRRSRRGADAASLRKDIALHSDASLGLLPYDLRAAGSAGSGAYTLAQIGKVGASALASQGSVNGGANGTLYRV